MRIPGLISTIRSGMSPPRAAAVAFLGVVLLAACLRFYDLGHNSLSHGEALRLNQIDHGTISDLRWFPPLAIPLNKATLALAGTSEFGLRLRNALMGLGCVVALFAMVRRFVDDWSAVCVAAVAAVHPMLIYYGSRLAKEFSSEALFCVLITWAGMEAYRDLSRRRIIIFGVLAVLGMSLAYSPALLIAAWFPILFVAAWRSTANRQALHALMALALFLMPIAAFWYVWLSGCPMRAGVAELYGQGYGAWPESYTIGGLVNWCVHALGGVGRFTLGIEDMWPREKWVVGTLELVAVAASLGVCWRRCRQLCLAMLLLSACTAIVGAARQWPIGAIHTMTFAVPLVCVFIGCGLRHLVGRLGWSPAFAVIACGCLAIPGIRAGKDFFHPPDLEQTRPVFEYVLANAKPGDGVFVYYAVDSAFEFYWPAVAEELDRSVDGLPVLVQPRSDRGRFDTFVDRFAGFISKHRRVWFVFTHDHGDERVAWTGHLKQTYPLLDVCEVADASAHLVALPD